MRLIIQFYIKRNSRVVTANRNQSVKSSIPRVLETKSRGILRLSFGRIGTSIQFDRS